MTKLSIQGTKQDLQQAIKTSAWTEKKEKKERLCLS
jgi:hypothetical protein